MNAKIVLGLAVLALACSAETGADGGGDDEFSCDVLNECIGTYLVSYSETSGYCGAVPDQLIRIDLRSTGAGCTEDAPPLIRDDGCTLETAETCVQTGSTISGLTITRQSDEDCDVVTGLITANIYDDSGELRCVSTYRVRGERQ